MCCPKHILVVFFFLEYSLFLGDRYHLTHFCSHKIWENFRCVIPVTNNSGTIALTRANNLVHELLCDFKKISYFFFLSSTFFCVQVDRFIWRAVLFGWTRVRKSLVIFTTPTFHLPVHACKKAKLNKTFLFLHNGGHIDKLIPVYTQLLREEYQGFAKRCSEWCPINSTQSWYLQPQCHSSAAAWLKIQQKSLCLSPLEN